MKYRIMNLSNRISFWKKTLGKIGLAKFFKKIAIVLVSFLKHFPVLSQSCDFSFVFVWKQKCKYLADK
jgi:hypothetical protein